MPKISDNEEIRRSSVCQYQNQSFEGGCDEINNTDNDVSIMPVASGKNLSKDLDINRRFLDNERNQHQHQNDMPEMLVDTKTGDASHSIEMPDFHNLNDTDSGMEESSKSTLFFRDGIRSIDFVLVWDANDEDAITSEACEKRQIFENNLEVEGLELECEPPETNGLNFIKIHAPKPVLQRYSEILKLRLPMRHFSEFSQMSSPSKVIPKGEGNRWQNIMAKLSIDKAKFSEEGNQRFTAIFSRNREYLFDTESSNFFSPSIHSRIVKFILDRKRYSEDENDHFAFGIEGLLSNSVYLYSYPLHDAHSLKSVQADSWLSMLASEAKGDIIYEREMKTAGDVQTEGTKRNLLYMEWASIEKWYRGQPLDCVKEYFGVKIAIYFAWLGFYTNILIAPAFVGLICFIYSLSTMHSYEPSNDRCNMNLKMCPLCDGWCNYWNLKETCVHSRITYLFDNPSTVFFAIFMSFWATTFLEMWKRYSAEITHRWDLTGFDVQEEHPRPQYLARLAHVKETRRNIVTNTLEPQVPFWKIKVPVTIFSCWVVVLLVLMALATVLALVLYRMSVLMALKLSGANLGTGSAVLFTTITAACINLVAIVIFNRLYTCVATYLTEFELIRTQTEFDDSLTLKIYLLQFVNYYASIFYIAFFKGKFVGSPKGYNRIFSYRQEECGPGGCLLELSIQLAVIMVGKQALNAVLEMSLPLFFKWLNTRKVKTDSSEDCSPKKESQWLEDFKLVEWGPRSLFPEYLEMVLQYGFVTIFVAAFPLAPLFALLNNILEMRLDAKKLLTMHRRPVSQRVSDIGVWYTILNGIGKLSVITNGFIIAFTSDFIPRLVYRISVSPNGSLEGYLNNSLSVFNTSHFENSSRPIRDGSVVNFCRYPDYRNEPGSPEEYKRTALYWRIVAARLIFVVVFENLVALVVLFVKRGIPDMPSELRDRIRGEAYITNEIIIKQESLRTKNNNMSGKEEEKKIDTLRNIQEVPSTPEQWDIFLNKPVSQSNIGQIHGDEQQNCNNEPDIPQLVP